MNLAVPETA